MRIMKTNEISMGKNLKVPSNSDINYTSGLHSYDSAGYYPLSLENKFRDLVSTLTDISECIWVTNWIGPNKLYR